MRASQSRAARESFHEDVVIEDPDFASSLYAPQDAQDSHDSDGTSENANRSCQMRFSREAMELFLEDYVSLVLEFCVKLREEQSEDDWKSPLFNFARFCKAHRDLTELPSDKAMQTVESVMISIGHLAHGLDPWEHFFPEDEDGEHLDGDWARVDFMNSWNNVRHVPFRDVLQNAFQRSEENPIGSANQRGKLYQRFVSLAGWLQVFRCERGILLPTRTIAGLLSCDQRTVSRLRKLAVQDGLLEVVKGHTFRSAGKSEATEFRFAVERFKELRGKR